MKPRPRLQIVAAVLFVFVGVCFFLFCLYLGLIENVSTYSSRDPHSFTTVENYTVEQIQDDTAPVGIRTVYRLKMSPPQIQNSENCLCFYVSHHYAQVYFGDELIYSLTASPSNRIGKSVGSNWVTVPVLQEDSTQEVRIVLTPLFESVADPPSLEFLLGSHSAIIMSVLREEFAMLFISALCVFLGVFIVLVQLYFTFRTNARTWKLFFLGCFSVALGIWRITDLRSAPVLFPWNPMALSYISISSLYMSCLTLTLFLTTHFFEEGKTALLLGSIVYDLAALLVLVLQVLGIGEFRETLLLCHILFLAAIAILPTAALTKKLGIRWGSIDRTWKLFLILGFGLLLDLLLYYISGTTQSVIFTLWAFVVYALVMFMSNILNATRKAYVDSFTGLSNKSRWMELMNSTDVSADPVGIVILDMNGLKTINDIYGHEAGDTIIFQFSNILRNVFPPNSVICRWGGDEFSLLTTGIRQEMLVKYIEDLYRAAEEYNSSNPTPHIHFAVGYALSSEYPGLTRQELMSMADSRMYLNKKEWYAQQGTLR